MNIINCFICNDKLNIYDIPTNVQICENEKFSQCIKCNFKIYFLYNLIFGWIVQDIVTYSERISFAEKQIYGSFGLFQTSLFNNFSFSLPKLKEAKQFFDKWERNKIYV